ncbi:MAG: hemerythrin [Ilumatobacteraceae bacterium]|nr:hemerythrin [Ilumatobacteraceae bacterium]
MDNAPDISHFFAIHRKMRIDTRMYVRAIETATEADRHGRLRPLARWARGFQHELAEHHFVEDEYFFPDMRRRVPAVATVLDGLEADHQVVDGLLLRWPVVAAQLVDAAVPFERAQREALDVARCLRDLLERHLAVEDNDVLPLYWQHYSIDEYATVSEMAIKNGKKKGLTFFVPWNVACTEGAARKQLLDAAPIALKLVWYMTRGRFARLERDAFGGIHVDTGSQTRTVDAAG